MTNFCRLRATFILVAFVFGTAPVFSQAITTGSILGVVYDPSAAIVPGATVACVGVETGFRLETKTTEGGAYVCPNLVEGVYRLEVLAAGFARAVVNNVKVNVGIPTTTDVKLEVGATTEVLQVEAQSTPVITSTSSITTTVTGRQITELPLSTRSALDLAFQIPGAAGGGGPRYTSVDALPHGSLNVAIDGINVQDNLLKSASGGSFYTYITPRIDAVDEVTVSSAANSASSGEGAVQITFVTKRGTNDWHGGVFEYLRNDFFNANTWFNNVNGLPRQVLRLNQFGGRLGGPIKRNKLFIFGVWDDYRLPNAISRTRTVLKTEAIGGVYTYTGTDRVAHSVNVLQLAAANGLRSGTDANIVGLLKKIDSLRSGGQVGLAPLNTYEDTMTFNNVGKQRRYFPTGRLDYIVNDKMQVDIEWYYQGFRSFPDTLNSRDMSYPGFETLNGKPAQGNQDSNRHQSSIAFRWTPNASISNEFRFGENGGRTVFSGGLDQTLYVNNTRLGWPLGLTSPLNFAGTDSRRNTPVKTLQETLSWQKHQHTLNFGANFSYFTPWDRSISAGLGNAVPLASLGITSNDPASTVFSAANFPAINTTDLANAGNLYALLTGRLSGVSGVVNADPETHKFTQYLPLFVKNQQKNLGIFATDTWRLHSGVTLNMGLRWDYQGVPGNTNGMYSMPDGGYAGLWDVSGPDNLFKPGTQPGKAIQMVPMGQAWNKSWLNFAPSVGLAWSPSSDHWLSRAVLGKGGAFRVGYAITYSREGLAHLSQIAGANPGAQASASLVADRDFKAGTLFYDGTIPSLVTVPASYGFPLSLSGLTYTSNGTANWYDPSLHPPRVHSYSAGIQRQLPKAVVLEVRYVGNYGQDLWRQYNINEVNIFENGFLKEFQSAQNNLKISQAAGLSNFSNRGLAGQVPLPIMEAAFAGTSAFTNSTFVTNLTQSTAGNMASSIAGNVTYMPNLVKAGYPANFFVAAPSAIGGGAFLLKNGAWSNYNSLQIEGRRRMSGGLLVSASYVFAKGLSNLFGDAQSSGTQPITLRDFSLGDGPSPYDIRHAFKANWIYEFPFGPGKRWIRSNHSILSRIVGGWQWNGIARIQSGQAFQLQSGRNTYNNYEAGVLPLVPLSKLQSLVGVYKLPNKVVMFMNPTAVGTDGRMDPNLVATPATPGQLGYNVFLYGPSLVRVDSTLAKRTKVHEKWEVELRAEVLNVFNLANFMQASPSSSTATASIQSTTFGQTTNYYQDFNGSQDPGGRVIQLVFRLNF
jgi:hypothetical protein